jgi:hypothetical protein
VKKQSEAEYSKEYTEAQKVVFDYIKHITTLDTGSIILLALLLEKFFKTPQWKFLITVSFFGFSLSIIALTFAAFGIIRSIRTPLDISTGLIKYTSWSFLLGISSFLVGILSLAVFAGKNW